MRRYAETVLLLILALLFTLVWAMVREGRKPYKIYQETYRARVLSRLRAQAARETGAEPEAELLDRIRILEEQEPALREVILKGGMRERCLSCHMGIEQISDSHPVETFGCTICHGGDPLSVTLPAAHRGLIGRRNPSDFQVVDRGCGKTMPDGTACHNGDPREERDHIRRVKTTIMATKAGEIANPRYSFGAQKDLQARYGVVAVQGEEPQEREGVVPSLSPLPYTRESDLPSDENGNAVRRDLTGAAYTFSGKRVDTQLHRNCVNACHLWSRGGDEPFVNRASGCASCHYLYDGRSFYRGDDPTIPRDEPGHGPLHRLTLKIPYSQCNHCHNRGVHSLFTMRFDNRTDMEGSRGLSPEEARVRDYYNPMTLFTLCEYELDCIDCHTDQEVMGDGFLYRDKIAQQRIRCFTCHGTLERPPLVRELTTEESPKVQRILRTYGRSPGEKALFTEQGEILPHVRLREGRFYLTGKVTEKRFRLPLVWGSRCRQDPSVQDANSCHACHDIHLSQEGPDGAEPGTGPAGPGSRS